MDKLKQIDLGKRAIDFGFAMLSEGGVASRMIGDALRNRTKTAWTLLPEYVNPNQIYEFENGGISNIDCSEHLAQLLSVNLASDGNAAWILIDNIADPSEPIGRSTINGLTTPFVFQNELFQYLNRHTTFPEAIRETFRFGGAYPFVGLITKLNADLIGEIKRNKVSQHRMHQAIDNISEIVIGAYDEESYLVFQLPAAG